MTADPLTADGAARRPGREPRDPWELLRSLRRSADRDRDRAAEELARLFASADPSTGIDGRTRGMLVTSLIHPAVDRLVRAVTGRWMPWQGKRFDADHDRGDNLLARSARWPAKLLWPRYRMGHGPRGELTAFGFRTRTEPGALDDGTRVLAIDYAPVADNPDLVVRRVRDELVHLGDGVHLGRILFRRRGRYELIGYFALRSS